MQFKETKTLISNSYLIKQVFEVTLVNRTLPSLHETKLEVRLTVPLKKNKVTSKKKKWEGFWINRRR